MDSLLGGNSKLFGRLPEKFFSPLASINRDRYWSVICHLMETCFGPDAAEAPPINGFPERAIVQEIEAAIAQLEDWNVEDAEETDSPTGSTRLIFNRLIECGWLQREQFGLRDFISMRQNIVEIFNLLIGFASNPLIFVGGKVKSIRISLERVLEDPDSGDVLHEASQQARQLMEHIRSISSDIRDISHQLEKQNRSADYARIFFTDLIEQKFIGDYRTLRTNDHPLAERSEIVRISDDIDSNYGLRSRLLNWYTHTLCKGDEAKGHLALSKDLGRLKDLSRVDEFLQRLDEAVTSANRRATLYFEYTLRVKQDNDALIDTALQCVLAGTVVVTPFPVGALMGPDRLSPPLIQKQRREPSAITRKAIRPEERARLNLMKAAMQRRQMSAKELNDFLIAKLGDAASFISCEVSIEGVKDMRGLQELQRAAQLATSADSHNLRIAGRARLRGLTVICLDPSEQTHPYVTGSIYRVERIAKGKKNV